PLPPPPRRRIPGHQPTPVHSPSRHPLPRPLPPPRPLRGGGGGGGGATSSSSEASKNPSTASPSPPQNPSKTSTNHPPQPSTSPHSQTSRSTCRPPPRILHAMTTLFEKLLTEEAANLTSLTRHALEPPPITSAFSIQPSAFPLTKLPLVNPEQPNPQEEDS